MHSALRFPQVLGQFHSRMEKSHFTTIPSRFYKLDSILPEATTPGSIHRVMQKQILITREKKIRPESNSLGFRFHPASTERIITTALLEEDDDESAQYQKRQRRKLAFESAASLDQL